MAWNIQLKVHVKAYVFFFLENLYFVANWKQDNLETFTIKLPGLNFLENFTIKFSLKSAI